MGRPPDTHSAHAPAGTTAAPGLTPDLATPIPCRLCATPGLRWALMAAAVIAGALLASCLLCTVCCCHRGRRRKRPRDKEAVVLSTTGLTTTTHLVQPELGNVASGPGGAQQWGRLQLSLEYDSGSQEVPPAELPGTSLRVLLLDHRRLSQHWTLGMLSLPLGSVDLQHVLELWHPLGPPATAEPEQTEELCFSLRYVPGSGQLTVVVLEARGLSPALADPYVKVQLLLNQRKWKKRKTSARKGMATPYYNEAFTFLVPFSQIQSVDLVLAVWARGPQLRDEPVGKVLLGSRAAGQPLQHWADMLAQARRPVAQWHRLQPAREVDQALALQSRPRLPLPGF
nr:synaptotagmin-8 isoform X6 [Bubalus bubalis]